MTINLPAMKALADRLAVDIMNQLERDGMEWCDPSHCPLLALS